MHHEVHPLILFNYYFSCSLHKEFAELVFSFNYQIHSFKQKNEAKFINSVPISVYFNPSNLYINKWSSGSPCIGLYSVKVSSSTTK